LPQFQSCIGRLSSAVLTLTDRALFRATTITLLVTTPRSASTDNRWFLEGRLVKGNIQVGWGVAMGVVSETLRAVSVTYGNFRHLKTNFLVQLSTAIDVRDGGAIVILPPSGYLLTCEAFLPYALPFSGHKDFAISCTERQQGVSIGFAHATLRTEVQYSFLLVGFTPARSTSMDTFEVQVLKENGRVVEASYEVPASPLLFFGDVATPYLLWYDRPIPGTRIWITVGILIPLRAPAGLDSIRVTLPEGVRHSVVTTARDNSAGSATLLWQISHPKMNPPGTFSSYLEWTELDRNAAVTFNGSIGDVPVADQRRWLDLGRPDEVEVRFQAPQAFPPCEMLLRFPIDLPNTLPVVNIWQVSFVFMDSAEAASVASFVLPGFTFGASSDAALAMHAQHMFQARNLDYFTFSKLVANEAQRPHLLHFIFVWPLLAYLSCVSTQC